MAIQIYNQESRLDGQVGITREQPIGDIVKTYFQNISDKWALDRLDHYALKNQDGYVFDLTKLVKEEVSLQSLVFE